MQCVCQCALHVCVRTFIACCCAWCVNTHVLYTYARVPHVLMRKPCASAYAWQITQSIVTFHHHNSGGSPSRRVPNRFPLPNYTCYSCSALRRCATREQGSSESRAPATSIWPDSFSSLPIVTGVRTLPPAALIKTSPPSIPSIPAEAPSPPPAGAWLLALVPLIIVTVVPIPWLLASYIGSSASPRGSPARDSRGYEMASVSLSNGGSMSSFSSVSGDRGAGARREPVGSKWLKIVGALVCVLVAVAEAGVAAYMEVGLQSIIICMYTHTHTHTHIYIRVNTRNMHAHAPLFT
jgi:hypothetical protein